MAYPERSGFTKKSLMTTALKLDFQVVYFKNFAGHYEFLKRDFFTNTKVFLIELLLLPVSLVSIPLRKQYYLETILKKTGQI